VSRNGSVDPVESGAGKQSPSRELSEFLAAVHYEELPTGRGASQQELQRIIVRNWRVHEASV
jgi:hypothetical protein